MEKEIIITLIAYMQNCDLLSTDTDELKQQLLDIFGYSYGMDESEVLELIH